MNRHLFELQETDNRITALKRERSRLDNGEAVRAECDTLERAIEVEANELSRINAVRSVREDELKTAETKIAQQETRLMNAKNAHEVSSLQRDIEALQRARGDLDEAILVLMDQAESSATRVRDLAAQKAELDVQLAGIKEHFATETARLEHALQEALAQRQENIEKLSGEELEKYAEFARRFHGVAVARNADGNCSACGTTLTPYNLKEAKKQQWPTCESCGRLLWLGA
jgi:predicted  nucleic acid-binding Zn-ribbon protein